MSECVHIPTFTGSIRPLFQARRHTAAMQARMFFCVLTMIELIVNALLRRLQTEYSMEAYIRLAAFTLLQSDNDYTVGTA